MATMTKDIRLITPCGELTLARLLNYFLKWSEKFS
jgi:hypothetical protein